MFRKLMTHATVFSILLWAPSSIAMETGGDDLDAVLKELPPIHYQLTAKAYAEKASRLEKGYGPMTIPKSFIHEQLSHAAIPQDYVHKIAPWDVLLHDKELTNKIRTDIAALAANKQSSVQFAGNLGNAISLEQINNAIKRERNSIKYKIKNDFVDIRLKPWSSTFFKSLSQEERDAIAKSARCCMAFFQKDDAQNSL